MYMYIMVRTQIYLSDDAAKALEREARAGRELWSVKIESNS